MVLGVPPRPVPQAASSDAAAAPGHRGGRAAGSPRAPPSALLAAPPTPRPPRRRHRPRWKAARRVRTARSRPGPWALPGGREVGTWGGAEQHTSSLPQATLAPRGPGSRHARRRRGSATQVSARARAIPSGAPVPARPRSGRRAHKVELRAPRTARPGSQGGAQSAGAGCAVWRGEGHWMRSQIPSARGSGLAGNFCGAREYGGSERRPREAWRLGWHEQSAFSARIPGRRERIPVEGRTRFRGFS